MVLAEKPTTAKLLDLSIFWKTQTSGYYEFLSRAVEERFILVFEHDPTVEAATVTFADGRFEIAESFALAER